MPTQYAREAVTRLSTSRAGRRVKDKLHYASWFGTGSKLVRSWFELKFGLSSSLLAAN